MTNEIWYSYTLKPYLLEEASFYDPADFEWTEIIENSYQSIREELLIFLTQKELKPYFNRSLLSGRRSWQTDGLLFWGYLIGRNKKHFRKSWKALKNIPGLVSFSISLMEPNSYIKAHNGDTNAIIRIHLPIIVPEGPPKCSFTVKGESRGWTEGKVLMFNDAQEHSAQNLSDKRRLVLLLDVIRPEFTNRKYEICAKVLNGLGWQWMTQAYPGIRKYPLWFKRAIWSTIRFFLRIILRVNRLIKH